MRENEMTPLMTIDAANDQRVRRPRNITSVAALQLLIAASFLSVPIAGAVYGDDVRTAAKTEAARRGFPLTAVTASDLRFGGSRTTTVLLVVAALALVPLSLLNLHGRRVGRMLSWIVLPVAFVGNLFLAGDRTTVRSGQDEDEEVEWLDI
jgi:hypothetical protein